MITREALSAAGYKTYPDNLRGAKCVWQQRIRDENGTTLYFIDISEWDFSVLDMPKDVQEANRFSAEVQFTTVGERFNFSLFLNREHTVEKVEAFYQTVYQNLNCTPYDD